MGYIKAEYTGKEMDFHVKKCHAIECMRFACGVVRSVLDVITEEGKNKKQFENAKAALIKKNKSDGDKRL